MESGIPAAEGLHTLRTSAVGNLPKPARKLLDGGSFEQIRHPQLPAQFLVHARQHARYQKRIASEFEEVIRRFRPRSASEESTRCGLNGIRPDIIYSAPR